MQLATEQRATRISLQVLLVSFGNSASVSVSVSVLVLVFFFSFFGARLDNKCQHLAAANLFAPPMRSPQEGRPDRRIDLMAARVGTPISDRATGWKSEGIVRGERDF